MLFCAVWVYHYLGHVRMWVLGDSISSQHPKGYIMDEKRNLADRAKAAAIQDMVKVGLISHRPEKQRAQLHFMNKPQEMHFGCPREKSSQLLWSRTGGIHTAPRR